MIFSTTDIDFHTLGYPKVFVKALTFLTTHDFTTMEPGRLTIQGTMMYANLDIVHTKAYKNSKPEQHQDYIDVQYIVRGREDMGFYTDRHIHAPIESHPDKDCWFYANDLPDEGIVHAVPGSYAIFFPSDIHRPLLAPNDQPEPVLKVVVKIHKSLLR